MWLGLGAARERERSGRRVLLLALGQWTRMQSEYVRLFFSAARPRGKWKLLRRPRNGPLEIGFGYALE